MLSLRLQKIADLVKDGEKVLDIGTDHAYLPIYLVQKRQFSHVWASDISAQVLKQSSQNIQKYHLNEAITLIESDGFAAINMSFDVAIIAGMGCHTIIKILEKAKKLPAALIIQSNNNLPLLRTYLNKLAYKIVKEEVIFEKGKYYVIFRYEKGKEKLTKDEILFGKNYHKEYLMALLNKDQEIWAKSHNQKLLKEIKNLTNFIEKIPD